MIQVFLEHSAIGSARKLWKNLLSHCDVINVRTCRRRDIQWGIARKETMLRKGFVEIQIEMLGTMLAKILFPKSHADYGAASLAIRQASQHETGLDIFVLASLTDDSL